MNILILDVGTSSMRGTLMDRNTKILEQVQVRYQPSFLGGGIVEQDPQDWICAAVSACREICRKGTVDAVAVTSQRSSVIPINEEGVPLTHAIMWQDTRHQAFCDSISAQEETVRHIAGTGINTVFSGGKMAWLRQDRPDIYEKAARLCVIPDYLIFRMTGQFVTDRTYGSRSMLMDLRTGEWSRELLDLFGLEEHRLCRLIPTCSVAGTVTEAFSAQTGIAAGVPVITCGGDQQCSAAGQGVIRPGCASVNLGTGAYLVSAADRVPEQLPQGMTANASAIADQYILESSVLTCGAALDWYLKLIGAESTSYVRQALEQSPPGANGVCIRPWFQGRSHPNWDSTAQASFHGITLSTTKADLLRALLEGIFCEIRAGIRTMEAVHPIESIRISGGMSGTDAVCRLLADVTGKTVIRTGDGEATTRGAWMSAAVCLGLANGWAEAWKAAKPSTERIYIPNPEHAALYEQLAARLEQTGKETAK